MSRFLSLLTVPFFLSVTPATSIADEREQVQPWHWMLGLHTNYQHTLRNPEVASTPVLYSVQRLDNAAVEGTVLLSQQAYLFTPDEPMRRRIYQFIRRRQGWVQHIFEVSAELPSTQLAQPEHWRPVHGCSIRWQQQGDYFFGKNDAEDCYFFVEESGERVEVSSSVKLYPDYFVVTDDLQFDADSDSQPRVQNTHTEYQRTTFYDAEISYSAHRDDDWQVAEPTAQVHDQGARVGFVLQQSALELRYQIELQRTLSQLTLKLHDLSQGEVVHEETFADDVEVIEFNSSRLRIKLKPRP